MELANFHRSYFQCRSLSFRTEGKCWDREFQRKSRCNKQSHESRNKLNLTTICEILQGIAKYSTHLSAFEPQRKLRKNFLCTRFWKKYCFAAGLCCFSVGNNFSLSSGARGVSENFKRAQPWPIHLFCLIQELSIFQLSSDESFENTRQKTLFLFCVVSVRTSAGTPTFRHYLALRWSMFH